MNKKHTSQHRISQYRVLDVAIALAVCALLNAAPTFAQDASPTISPTPNATPTPSAVVSAALSTARIADALSVSAPMSPTQLSPAPSNLAAGLSDLRREQSATAEELDLESALVLALQNNPQRGAALAAVNASQARVGTARSAGGVQVGLNGNAGFNRAFGVSTTSGGASGSGGTGGTSGGTGGGTNTGGGGTGVGSGGSSSSGGSTFLGFNTSQSVGVDATIPIYNGGRVKSSTRVAQAGVDVAAAQERQTEQDLVLNTTLGYLNILRNDELLRVADSNVAVSQERLRIANVRFTAGAAARLEVLTAQTILANAVQGRATSSATSAQSRSTLNSLIGRAPETPIRVRPIQSLQLNLPLVDGAISSPLLRQTAEVARPAIDLSRSQIRASEASVDLAKAQRKPNLGLSLGALLRNPVSFAGRFALSIGLGLSQSLFDSGRSRSQIDEAQAVLEQTRQGLSSQRLFVANQIEQSLLALDSSQARVTATGSAVSQADEALRAANLGFGAGARTSLDVSEAQTQLLTAQTNAVNARYDVAQSQAQLAAAVGVLTTEGQNAANRVGATEAEAARAIEVATPVKKKRKKFLGIF